MALLSSPSSLYELHAASWQSLTYRESSCWPASQALSLSSIMLQAPATAWTMMQLPTQPQLRLESFGGECPPVLLLRCCCMQLAGHDEPQPWYHQLACRYQYCTENFMPFSTNGGEPRRCFVAASCPLSTGQAACALSVAHPKELPSAGLGQDRLDCTSAAVRSQAAADSHCCKQSWTCSGKHPLM